MLIFCDTENYVHYWLYHIRVKPNIMVYHIINNIGFTMHYMIHIILRIDPYK
jgi:hypothetical protein